MSTEAGTPGRIRSQATESFAGVCARAPVRVLRFLASRLAPKARLERNPGWFFDVSDRDHRVLTNLRREVWRAFHVRGIHEPITVPWLAGLRLHVRPFNDLGKCIYVGASFEPNEFAFLRDFLRPGMTFVDIGANEGAYTVFAARSVGPSGTVVAIEPSERELGRLLENISLNTLTNVTVVEAAVGDAEGIVDLAVAEEEHAGQNTIGDHIANSDIRTDRIERVPMRTLDSILEEHGIDHVDFVKIDAEGSEALVLSGAKRSLASIRPVVQLEINPAALQIQGASVESVIHQLRELDYAPWVFDESTALLRGATTDALSGNVIFAPSGWAPPEPHGSQ